MAFLREFFFWGLVQMYPILAPYRPYPQGVPRMAGVLLGALLTGVVTMGTATLRKGSGKAGMPGNSAKSKQIAATFSVA